MRLAPPAPKLARGLTPAKTLADGSVLFAPDAAHGFHVYVDELEKYPRQCQEALDQLGNVLDTECAEARRIDAAQAVVSSDQRSVSAEAHKMTFGKVMVPVSIAAVLAFVGGIIFEARREKKN